MRKISSKFIYTSNQNYVITRNVNKEGKLKFGEKVIYFTEEWEREPYSFRTSAVVSAVKKENCVYIETLNSTYIFELLEDIEIPNYHVSQEFYEEHQKMMQKKSNKFLIKDIDGFISVVELENELTRDEAIDYFDKNKIPVDNVIGAV